MDFYFTDRSWHLLGIATAGEGPIHIVNDTDDQLNVFRHHFIYARNLS